MSGFNPAGGLRVGEVGTVADGGPQPGETPFGSRQQFSRLLLREPPAAGLGEQDGEEQCGLRARAARREERAGVAARPGNHAGPWIPARELCTGQGAQCAHGEPGAEGQGHAGGGEGLGGRHPAAPRRACGQVDVGGVVGVDRTVHAQALRERGADVVVDDLAELLERR